MRGETSMRICKQVALWALWLAVVSTPVGAQQFYPDDPLWTEPPPYPAIEPAYRALNEIWELLEYMSGQPGQRHSRQGVIPAMAVNTLGEVPDSGWYTNRHASKTMSASELVEGPGTRDPPSKAAPWQVLTVKKYDIRPGMLVADSDGELYLLSFDPKGYPEMSTGASMVASRLFYALGYWVPENYLVHFDRSQVIASPEGEDINAVGRAWKLTEENIDLFLEEQNRDPQRGYRAVATKVPGGRLIGPYQMYGTRSDDPNDIVPHEHRRDLRGLRVISAWMDYNWVRAMNTLDVVVEENGVPSIRHYIVDLFTAFGSGFQNPKSPREGYEPLFDFRSSLKNLFGMGIYSPKWQRARFNAVRSIGRFESEIFDPERWVPNADIPPLANSLPDDDYWAAKKVMAFSDADIRAIVKSAEYADPEAEEWLIRCLIERRDKIGRTFFSKVLSLDNFRIDAGKLEFDDLSAKYGFVGPRQFTISWTGFHNFTREFTPIADANSFTLPEQIAAASDGTYFAARISAGVYQQSVTVYVRKQADTVTVVGVDREWPGLTINNGAALVEVAEDSSYSDLNPRQVEMFERYTKSYTEATGFDVTPEEYFRSLSLSERTTFDAVTHALMNTEVHDANGSPAGTALDLVDSVKRVAGQYYGRQGDEQFRVYVTLKPESKAKIENAPEFHREKDNTVFHVGFPLNYRQGGQEPTLQISMAEDGLSADIDVDYRSSKMPQAMWNGHLTSANSDVRAGDNYARHNNRWSGLINWWQAIFGRLPEKVIGAEPGALMVAPPPQKVHPLPPNRPTGADIPEIGDAAQEFLADWLVRRNYDEAMEFVSDEALPCILLDLRGLGPRNATRRQMRQSVEEFAEMFNRRHETLSGVIERVPAWGPNLREVEHRYSDDFYLGQVSDAVADSFLCGNRTGGQRQAVSGTQGATFGTYYGTIFRFRLESTADGAFAVLWKKEDGRWKVVSYDVIAQ